MLVIGFYLILGTVMEPMPMMVITAPTLTPIMAALGYDPVWFGILIVILSETALISPPVGANLFVVQGIRNRGSMNDVFVGVMPFCVTLAHHDRADHHFPADRPLVTVDSMSEPEARPRTLRRRRMYSLSQEVPARDRRTEAHRPGGPAGTRRTSRTRICGRRRSTPGLLSLAGSSFGRIRDIPGDGNPGIMVLKRGSQDLHLRGVALLALAITDHFAKFFPEAVIDRDIVLCGALCHDIGKAWECDPENQARWHADPTVVGRPSLRHPGLRRPYLPDGWAARRNRAYRRRTFTRGGQCQAKP